MVSRSARFGAVESCWGVCRGLCVQGTRSASHRCVLLLIEGSPCTPAAGMAPFCVLAVCRVSYGS